MPDGTGIGMIQLGVVLFVTSDLILALGLFVARDAAARTLAEQLGGRSGVLPPGCSPRRFL